ncbi:AAA family ATPase [Leekyejoonella antrihumi]|uniref:Phosphotransferase n=1 Tax=Leekyejoonella antrihumi TaxID=1660198 RepID=A0A563E1W7_9MICO|nr:AAA family ATPase [Leekyejoonella antrihumi]TWP36540.1 phosphotransferase [Leekyejoonella antrihumi]
MTAPDAPSPGRLFVITGAQAAGKSTVGLALAEALSKAVFIDGDLIGNTVVSGKDLITEPATVGAIEQLFLRYAGALTLADVYRTAGFDAVVADNIFGDYLDDFLEIAAPEPVHLVVLHPSIDTIYDRDAQRRKNAYRDGITVEDLWHTVEEHTSRVGLWLDTTSMSVAQTITRVLRNLNEALVDTADLADS